MVVWIAGKRFEDSLDWEVLGVFDEERKAVDACVAWGDFVAPLKMNVDSGQETIAWPGLYYPVANGKLAAASLGNDWLDGYVPREA